MEGGNNIILIRHGQSNFNRGYLDFKQTNNINMETSWENCLDLPGFSEAVSYSEKYFDSKLTLQGIKQCQLAREELKNEDIDLILVSPYQRALETCREIFGGRKIPVQVHPILAQVFRFSCDIGHELQQKRQEFSAFDFCHMNDSTELWFLQHLAPHHQEQLSNHLDKPNDPLNYQEKQSKLLKLLKQKIIYESAQELRQRMWKMKQILAEYSKKYKKIAIVSHYHIVQCLLSEKFDAKGNVVDSRWISNAQPIRASLANMLKVQ